MGKRKKPKPEGGGGHMSGSGSDAEGMMSRKQARKSAKLLRKIEKRRKKNT